MSKFNGSDRVPGVWSCNARSANSVRVLAASSILIVILLMMTVLQGCSCSVALIVSSHVLFDFYHSMREQKHLVFI